MCFCHQDEVLHRVTGGVDANSPEGGGQGLWLDVQSSNCTSYLGTKHLDEKILHASFSVYIYLFMLILAPHCKLIWRMLPIFTLKFVMVLLES